jgi:hypothetical protein
MAKRRDPEVEAIRAVFRLLAKLDPAAALRVLDYVRRRIEAAARSGGGTGSAGDPAGGGLPRRPEPNE